jgi:hypothetical protein
MKTRSTFRILLVLGVLFVVLAAVGPVYADTSYHYRFSVDDYYTWLAADNPCGFDIVLHTVGTSGINYWLDDTGRLTKEIDVNAAAKTTLSAYGKSLRGISGPYMYISRTENQYMYRFPATGPILIAPGYGKVFGGVALAVQVFTFDPATNTWNLTFSKHVGWDGSTADWGPFCAYYKS